MREVTVHDMSQDFDTRMKELLAKKAVADRAASEVAEAAKRKALEVEQRKQAIRTSWRACRDWLFNVLNDIQNVSNDAIHFEPASGNIAMQAHATLEILEVHLILDGRNSRYGLTFTVNADGEVQVTQLVGSAPSRKFHVDTLNRAALEEVVIGFLDQAITAPR